MAYQILQPLYIVDIERQCLFCGWCTLSTESCLATRHDCSALAVSTDVKRALTIDVLVIDSWLTWFEPLDYSIRLSTASRSSQGNHSHQSHTRIACAAASTLHSLCVARSTSQSAPLSSRQQSSSTLGRRPALQRLRVRPRLSAAFCLWRCIVTTIVRSVLCNLSTV